jgi:CubicO group peptidase (beta-lactamase class C family)
MRNAVRSLLVVVAAVALASAARADDNFCPDQGFLFVAYLNPVTNLSVGGAVVSYKLGEKPCYWLIGETKRGNNKRPDHNTIFELASLTKVFTTSILAIEGSQNLYDPWSQVGTRLPSGFSLKKSESGVTFSQLATFTGGFYWSDPPGYKNEQKVTQKEFEDAVNALDPTDAPNNFGPIPGEKDLPTVNNYSNSSVGFLGQILMSMDSTKHKTYSPDADGFSNWIADKLTGPLAMPNTAVEPGGSWATGYRYDPDGTTPDEIWNKKDPYPWVPWGAAGGLRSNIDDMFRFLKANICAYHTTDKECSDFPVDVLYALSVAHAPEAYNPAGKLPDPTIYVAGLCNSHKEQAWAWQYIAPPSPNPDNETAILEKGGDHQGFGSYIGFNPSKGYGIVVLLNTGHIGGLMPAGEDMIRHTH